MSEPITITATRAVWLTSYYSPDDLLAHMKRGDGSAIVDMVSIYGAPNKETFDTYVRVGEADVTIRFLPRDQQVAAAVKSLNHKLDELRAAYHQEQQEILEKINKLQAITYEPEAA